MIFHRAVEVLSRSQAEFEKLRLDMDMEVRDMKYRLDNEIKARITAEGLVSQLKEQLKRGDEKLTSYDCFIIVLYGLWLT